MTALPALAAVTSRIRVGTLVYDVDYRHPVIYARASATLHLIAGGRSEFGLGAGWLQSDYEQSGIPKDPAGVRVDRMEEAISVLKGCFGDDRFSYQGTHYTITGYDGLPKPVQRDRKSTRLNSSHTVLSRMPSSA